MLLIISRTSMTKLKKTEFQSKKETTIDYWRRGRDSNPRYVSAYALSRGAPSTTRPPLHLTNEYVDISSNNQAFYSIEDRK